MADWIKMRSGLLTNPKVTKMARTLLADPEFRAWYGNAEVTDTVTNSVTLRHVTVVTRVIVGGLLPVWTAVNESVGRDGHLRHAGLFEVDVMSGIPGFGAAMAAVDWLTELPDGEGLEFANFIEHNTVEQERSTHAKTAAERAKEYRDRKAAEKAAGVTNGVTEKRDASRDTVTTEKNREEKKNTPLPPKGGCKRFEEFWTAWPKSERKQDKVKCAEKWRRGDLDDLADDILADIAVKRQTAKWKEDSGKYIEGPLVYLNGRRWEDGVEAGSAQQETFV